MSNPYDAYMTGQEQAAEADYQAWLDDQAAMMLDDDSPDADRLGVFDAAWQIQQMAADQMGVPR